MYAFIRGKLRQNTMTNVVIEAGGVGYRILTASHSSTQMPQNGEELLLYTSFVVREQSQTLYGFLTLEECEFFEALLNVTGIGPKTALALIGHLPLHVLQKAIVDGDTALIAKTPGIGKKGAERLVVEMRDKVDAKAIAATLPDLLVTVDPDTKAVNDAMSALINLGYNQATAKKAITQSLKNVPPGINVADLISLALKHV